jgi:hypothetical protein
VAVQEGEAGTLSAPDTITVVGDDRMALTDLVVGARTANLRWQRTPEDTVFFNPSSAQRADIPLELFFEVVGIPAGESYRTDVKVSRPGGLGPISRFFNGGGSISVRYTEESQGERTPVQRSLDLSRLKGGTYTLEVTIERNGERVHQRTTFQVVTPPPPARAPTTPAPPQP